MRKKIIVLVLGIAVGVLLSLVSYEEYERGGIEVLPPLITISRSQTPFGTDCITMGAYNPDITVEGFPFNTFKSTYDPYGCLGQPNATGISLTGSLLNATIGILLVYVAYAALKFFRS